MRLPSLSLITLVLLAAAADGQTRYVSDSLVVPLRSGPSTRNAILRWLSAGKQVQVLEQIEEPEYSRVRVLDEGTEGWLETQYLVAEPIARDKLEAAQRALETARARVGELEEQVAVLTEELSATREALDEAQSANLDANSELAEIRGASANVLAIRDENETLQQRLVQSEREIASLRLENAELSSRERQNWFVIGAAVLLGGIVMGLILPSLRRRRRSDW
jgi:SH3 domain protein